jgi:branched-chain amino acid aminotransferase
MTISFNFIRNNGESMSGGEKERYVFFKGEIIPVEKANINIMSATAQYGINVFEGVRCYLNKAQNNLLAFQLNNHVERLFNSAKLIRFELPEKVCPDSIIKDFIDVINANLYREDIYVKMEIFLDNKTGWSSSSPIGILIYPFPKGRVFSEKSGIDCCVSSWKRIGDSDIPPRIKAGPNYLNSRLALLEANLNGYDYSIFLNSNGKVSEGPGACIFIIRNNRLITPPVSASILESITRQSILEFAEAEFNIKIEEREVDRTELYIADEIFFAGTSIEIVPVSSVDRIQINNNMLGEITKNLSSTYFEITRGGLKKYHKWIRTIYS